MVKIPTDLDPSRALALWHDLRDRRGKRSASDPNAAAKELGGSELCGWSPTMPAIVQRDDVVFVVSRTDGSTWVVEIGREENGSFVAHEQD